MRYAIVGLPGCGKTTLAKAMQAEFVGWDLLHTDDFADLPWDVQADHAMLALPRIVQPRYIVEGITVARMLRKGFDPDVVIWILGGRKLPGMQKLVDNGLDAYGGRIVTLPYRPSLDAALWALEQKEEGPDSSEPPT